MVINYIAITKRVGALDYLYSGSTVTCITARLLQ